MENGSNNSIWNNNNGDTTMNVQQERRAIEITVDEFRRGYADKMFPVARINQYVERHGCDEWIDELAEDYELIRRAG